MKIIDILNDYANGKIKEGFKFRYDNKDWVIEDDSIHSINRYSNYADMGEYVYFEDCFDLSNLNDEVEIIEEPKELKELKEIKTTGDEFYCEYIGSWIKKEASAAYCEYLSNKINEIIRHIKDKENK